MTIAQRPSQNPVAATPVGSTLADTQRQGLEATSAAQRHAVERLARLCEEGLHFTNRRMDENRRTFHEITAARTLPDMLSIWSRYVEQTSKQYSEQLQVLSDLYARQVWETVDDVQQGIAIGVEATRVSDPS